FQIGKLLYSQRVGVIAGLFIAFMPYHVVVSRQVLLDGPMTLFATLTLYLLARFAISQRPAWLYAAAGSMGLAVLSKETASLLVGGIYIFLALCPEIRLRLRDLLIATVVMVTTLIPSPLVPALAKGGNSQKAG